MTHNDYNDTQDNYYAYFANILGSNKQFLLKRSNAQVWLKRLHANLLAIQLYDTKVLYIFSDNSFIINTGLNGKYNTVTTRRVINRYLPIEYHVNNVNGQCCLTKNDSYSVLLRAFTENRPYVKSDGQLSGYRAKNVGLDKIII